MTESSGTSSLAQQLSSDSLPLAIALMLVLAGFAGRIALAPLHFSAPDVLEGAPSPVSAFLTLVYKVAGFGALLRFLAALFVQDHVSRTLAQYAGKFGLLLAILAAVTMAIGTLGAMRQAGLKRWLAYSSIAHSGFAMIGVACLNETGFNAALVYLAISTLTHAGAFAFLICFERTAGTERLEDLRGLGWRSPIAGVGLTLLMLSLTGLPPTVGFYGKYRLFAEAWNDGLGWLMFTAALATLISLSTSLRVARVLFFHTPSTTQPATQPARARVLLVLAVALSLATLCFGIWPRSIEQWANSALDLLRE